MNKKFMIVAAVLCLTACGNTNSGEPVTSYADNAETSAASEISETSAGAVHDIDPEAEGKGLEGVPYFFSSRSEEVTFVPSEETVKFNGRHILHNDVEYLS